MNDRFKFRTWDKEAELWCGIEYLQLASDGGVSWKKNGLSDHLILMQCTGLKDKNGKLIYEGDILNLKDEDVSGYGVVNWGDAGWFVDEAPILELTDLEVVGNIYENPELLNQKP